MYGIGLSVATAWGTDPAERAAAYRCDEIVPDPAEAWFRAVTVRASRPTVFRWLCQLRVAPYSYDLLDNGSRRRALAWGDLVMTHRQLANLRRLSEATEAGSPPP
jgi:hypothetical protein